MYLFLRPMKKSLGLAISFVVLVGTASAYDEERHDGFKDPVSEVGKRYSQEALYDAIKKRQWYYIKNKYRDADYKTIANQIKRHNINKKNNHVGAQKDVLKRTGDLKFVPFYNERRKTNKATYVRPNFKQVFRARAMDYYLDNGDAGKKALNDNVLYGSTYRVPRLPHYQAHPWAKFEKARVNKEIREVQKKITKTEKIATGHQKTTFRRGDAARNYIHPFMKILK